MPDTHGRFKKGEHWRSPQPFWSAEWLRTEYVDKQRSAPEIASEFGIGDTAILYWLKKHSIPTRTIKEARAVKAWGLHGAQNGMFGKTGSQNPRWKGGITAERQGFYSRHNWQEVAKLIWKRDKGRCQNCGQKAPGTTSDFHIHHIVSFSVEEFRAEADNLVLVCRPCHRWIHSRHNKRSKFLNAAQSRMGT